MAYSDVKNVVLTVETVEYEFETATLQIDAQFEDIRPHGSRWEEQGLVSCKWSLQCNQVDAYGSNPNVVIPDGTEVDVSFYDADIGITYEGTGVIGSQSLAADKSQAAVRQTIQIMGSGILEATPDS